jgi:beta-glucosidase
MVVIHSIGVRLVDEWFDNPNITPVVPGHLPGQDSGGALIEHMYGRQSFSGRLPYTVTKRRSDYGHVLDPALPSEEMPFYQQVNFTEAYISATSISPRRASSHDSRSDMSLTYMNFNYSGLNIYIDPAASRLRPDPELILQGDVDSHGTKSRVSDVP